MGEQLTLLFPLLVSAFGASGLGIFFLRHAITSLLARWLCIHMLAIAAWGLLYVGELLAPDAGEKLAWDSAQWLPTLTVLYTWFRLALIYTEGAFISRRLLDWLFVPILAFLLLLYTDPYHRLVFATVRLEVMPPFNVILYDFTPPVIAILLYGYALYLGGVLIIINHMWSEPRHQRSTSLLLTIVSSTTILTLIVLIFTDTRILGQRDVGPLVFGVSGVVTAAAVWWYRLLDIVPLARAVVFDTLREGVIVVDQRNVVVDVNTAALRAVGKPMSQVLRQPLLVAFDRWSAAFTHIIDLEEGELDMELVDVEGEPAYVDLRIVPIHDGRGGVFGRVITYRDITERVRSEKALSNAKQRARLLTDTAFEGITIHQQGYLIDANRAFFDLVGYTPDELRDVSLTETLLTPEFRQRAYTSIAEQGDANEETEIIHKDGTRIPVEMRSRQIDERLRVTAVRDLRDRQAAEANRLAAALERERMALLAEFVRAAAHEFRTPLANISTTLYLLSKIHDAAQRAERIKGAERTVKELAALLDHMILMVKLDNTQTLIRQPVQINSLLNVISYRFESEMTAKKLKLHFDPGVDLPVIMGDETLLSHAFHELLDNAVRFTPDGGAITITTRRRDQMIEICISDTGTGMTPEQLARAFERFYRADEARTTRGFGLGLAIVARVLELHKGRIEGESVPAKGTGFRVMLPLV